MNLPSSMPPGLRRRLTDFVQKLQEWPWLDTMRTLRLRFSEDRLGLTASSLTFTTLIALVPLLTVMLAVFTAFPMFSSFQAALEKYFLQSLVPPSIAKPVLGALTQFASKANRLGTAGLIALFITALMLMLTIDRTLNAIWRVRKPRPIAQRVLVYWAAMTLGPLVLSVSLTLTSYALSASKGVVGGLPGGVAVLFGIVEFFLFWAGMTGLFRHVPNTHVRWRDALAGGFFVAAGFELAKRGLAWYVKAVPTYSSVYGAFATLPIFLIWIYLGWVIVLLGAVIAAYRPSLELRVVRHRIAPGWQFSLALAVLREMASARGAGRGVTVMQLAQALRIDPVQIDPVLETLMGLDWVGRLEEAGEQRMVLLCDPAATKCEPLIAQVLLEPLPATSGLWRRAGLGEMMVLDAIGGEPAIG